MRFKGLGGQGDLRPFLAVLVQVFEVSRSFGLSELLDPDVGVAERPYCLQVPLRPERRRCFEQTLTPVCPDVGLIGQYLGMFTEFVAQLRISANVTGDFGNVTDPRLGAGLRG